jgi:hypothetical protein
MAGTDVEVLSRRRDLAAGGPPCFIAPKADGMSLAAPWGNPEWTQIAA